MKILTKKEEQYLKDVQWRKMLFLAQRVYEQTLVWSGNTDEAIPDKGKALKQMCEDIFLVDDVVV